ncbi:MAG: alkaline shock response membrane anchor protein AmaP [Candidatus Omnitrophota bacterium]|nr:MAG: alkaline shock response membrane anchor protein AmaP [Candidatus Omnitrophota bacterium]RKY44696.1 MAG: alkaline shock response membrane anchor protein AmaP [Candidatus Omnitrophota bacterium]
MGFFSSLIYITVSFFTGGLLILIALSSFYIPQIENALTTIYSSPNLRLISGLTGLLIILICIKTIQSSLAKVQREKTIAFEGNYGPVSISLSAVEEIIKKLLLEFKELKEVKPQVIASKRGLEAVIRIALSSYTNIPEFTSKIQSLVKEKVQNMLGIEEDIQIKIEIRKILYPDTKLKKKEKREEPFEENPSIPYREYES